MDKVARAKHAEQLLRDDTLREALNAVYKGYQDTMLSQGVSDEMALEARRGYHALQQVETRLRSFIADGRIEDKRKSGP